jgi:murein biosynthesis integral membrane protein MurJ
MPVFIISAVTICIKIVGFAEKLALAYFFGTSSTVEAYFVALGFTFSIFILVREIAEKSFLPLFAGYWTRQDTANVSGVFQVTIAASASLSLLTVIVLEQSREVVARTLAPGLPPVAQAELAEMIGLFLLGVPVLAVSAVTYLALNALGHFGAPAASDLVLKLGLIAGIAAAGTMRMGTWPLFVGVMAGAVGRLGMHIWALRKRLRGLVKSWAPRRRHSLEIGRLAAPVALGAVFAQVSDVADNWFSSFIGSGIAARTYAWKIVDLPLLVLPYALATVLLPRLASLHAEQRNEELTVLLRRSLRAMLIVFVPIACVAAAAAEPMVSLLLERGAFGAASRIATARLVSCYALGLPVFAVEAVLVPAYFAVRRPATPVLLGMIGVCVNLMAMVILVPSLGTLGVALALIISKTLKVIALVWRMAIIRQAFTFPRIRDYLVAAVFCSACTALARSILPRETSAGISINLSVVLGLSVVAGSTFFGAGLLLGGSLKEAVYDVGRVLTALIRGCMIRSSRTRSTSDS